LSKPRLIDVHSHIVPRTLPADPTGGGIDKWPCVQCQSLTAATVLMGIKPFREIDERSWDVDRRVADMDRDEVAAQVLSPMPELLSYWLDVGPATELARYVNGAIAAMVAERPDRFYGLGSVPLQDPEKAAEELRADFEKRLKALGYSPLGTAHAFSLLSGSGTVAEALKVLERYRS